MTKSESPARVSSGADGGGRLRLSEAPVGTRGVVRSVAPDLEAELAREGLVPGAAVIVERRIALGGPVIVRLGSARLAVARPALHGVAIELEP